MTTAAISVRVNPVNRENEKEEFTSALGRVRVLGSIFQTLYEWYGGPGIGKSTLLNLLMDECENISIPYSSINFSAIKNPSKPSYHKDMTLLIEDLLDGIADERDSNVRNAIELYRKEIEKKDEYALIRKVSQKFVRLVGQIIEKTPVVFFFDETEQANQDVVNWLEEWIINPLVQDGRCLIVWAGRRPQRWKRFEVRRRARVQELGVFDKAGTEKLFERNSEYALTDFASPVRRITGGHPYADSIVLQRLNRMAREGKKLKKDQFNKIEDSILDELVQVFIDSFVFSDLSPEVANACRAISLVRQFDVIMLRKILTKALPDTFGKYGRNEFGDLLSQLRATQLIYWDDRRKGYALDPILRHIIGEYICRRNSSLYIDVNDVAIDVYQDWINRAGDNRGVYIVEELYHVACLNQLSRKNLSRDKISLAKRLKDRIKEYHQNDVDLRAAALNRLYHELEDDHDLLGLIGENSTSKLLKIVRRSREEFN